MRGAPRITPSLSTRGAPQLRPSMGGSGMRGGPGMMGPGMGGGPGMMGPGMGEGGAAEPAEPTKVRFNLRILTLYDDRIPSPTDTYNVTGGPVQRNVPGGRDRTPVQNPSLSRVLRRSSPAPLAPATPIP